MFRAVTLAVMTWVTAVGPLLLAVAACVTAVVAVVRERGALRRVERLADLAPKLKAGSDAQLQVEILRDALATRYVERAASVPRRTAIASVVIGVALFVELATAVIIPVDSSLQGAWTAIQWASIGLLFVASIWILVLDMVRTHRLKTWARLRFELQQARVPGQNGGGSNS